jgi:hypothetical protein
VLFCVISGEGVSFPSDVVDYWGDPDGLECFRGLEVVILCVLSIVSVVV